jgi:hypothetical protein
MSERTDCATAKAAPSSLASATRRPVLMRFCVTAISSLVRFSDCSATMAPMLVFTEFKGMGFSCLRRPGSSRSRTPA